MNISVFVTSYNQINFLRQAIESVLAQTLAPNQIIIVDDASSDNSPDLIADYTRRYPELFTPIYHARNTGVAQVRIDALKAVRGDYVTYVDGDDWFLPDKLKKEAAALQEHPDAQIAFSNNEYITEDGLRRVRRWVNDEPVPQGDVFWQTFARAFPKRSLFRMELVNYHAWSQVGFHDPLLSLYEDFDMRIRLTKNLKVIYVNKVLSCIRTHQNGLSKSDFSKHFSSLDYIFRKNRVLLKCLPPSLHQQTVKELACWIAHIGKKAVKNKVRNGNFSEAFFLALSVFRYKTIR